MADRRWCAVCAISQPLMRVLCISARSEGQSLDSSPMEMTSSRYRATRVLNSWTIWRGKDKRLTVIKNNANCWKVHRIKESHFLFALLDQQATWTITAFWNTKSLFRSGQFTFQPLISCFNKVAASIWIPINIQDKAALMYLVIWWF